MHEHVDKGLAGDHPLTLGPAINLLLDLPEMALASLYSAVFEMNLGVNWSLLSSLKIVDTVLGSVKLLLFSAFSATLTISSTLALVMFLCPSMYILITSTYAQSLTDSKDLPS